MGSKREKIYMAIAGIITGLTNGIFGGGGGMVVVPLMIFLLKKPTKIAHATAIAVILPVSVVSAVFYIIYGSYSLEVGLPVGIGTVVGGLLGAILLKKLSGKWIIAAFSLVMFAAGVKMLFF